MDHIDAVNPTNIPAAYDGEPVAKITVFSNPGGQWFDMESGNADPVADARAIRERLDSGKWAGVYFPESWQARATGALASQGITLAGSERWPAPLCYLWCADPSGNIAAGRWTPPVQPVLVQDRYPGSYDLSTVHGQYPGRVAGYIDGPQSQWPSDAWNRFVRLPDSPTPPQPEEPDMPIYYIFSYDTPKGAADFLSVDCMFFRWIENPGILKDITQATLAGNVKTWNGGAPVNDPKAFGTPANKATADLLGWPWP